MELLGLLGGALKGPLTSLCVDYVRERLRRGATHRARRAISDALDVGVDHARLVQALGALAGPEASDIAGPVESYLRSPELANVANQLILLRLTQRNTLELDALQGESAALFALYASGFSSSEEVGAALFAGLLQGVDLALAEIPERDAVLTDDLRAEADRQFQHLHLAAIQRNIALLAARAIETTPPDQQYLDTFRGQVAFRHRNITPPNLGAARSVPLDEIYILPHLRHQEDESAEVGYAELCATLHRVVILGDPGGGKSTLSGKLVVDVAAAAAAGHRFAGMAPILVVMRDYGAWKEAHNGSILQYIESLAASLYQAEPPEGLFERVLLNGRGLVVFDGLDELLDTSARRELAGDVESFANRYPSIPILVTSRRVGYDQAPLDPGTFEVLALGVLTADDVAEYAQKWFRLDTGLSRTEQEVMAATFVDESAIVSDLRVNPLMLALMCHIYRGERYIPSNRPEVYEKCAVMLFERWDRERHLRQQLAMESHIRPAMMHLAHRIYTGDSTERSVSRSWLVGATVTYLIDKGRFSDPDDAAVAAREFIDFCTGRAWVFSDVGLDRDGEPLYEFTHGTFLEYFTASHLVRAHATPELLAAELLPRLKAAEWDMVAQLAVQMQDRNVEDGATRFLGLLLDAAAAEDRVPSRNVLSFVARSLGFVYPAIPIIEEVAGQAVRSDLPPDAREHPFAELCLRLAASAPENFVRLRSALAAVLASEVEQGNGYAAELMCQIGDTAPTSSHSSARREALRQWSDELVEANLSALLEHCLHHGVVALRLFERGHLTAERLVERHGMDVFMEGFPTLTHERGVTYLSFATNALAWSHSLDPSAFMADDRMERCLDEIGCLVLDVTPPLFTQINVIGFGSLQERRSADLAGLPPRAVFALAVLVAATVEVDGDQFFGRWMEPMAPLISARLGGAVVDEWRWPLLDGLAAGRDLLDRWARREISFVAGDGGIGATSGRPEG